MNLQVQRLAQYDTYFQNLLDETGPEHGRGAEYHDVCMSSSVVKQVSFIIIIITIEIIFSSGIFFSLFYFILFYFSFNPGGPRRR